jgi:hypothetical protein
MNDKVKGYILDGKKPVLTDDIDKVYECFHNEARIVKQEEIGKYYISTVFLCPWVIPDTYSVHNVILFQSTVFDKYGKELENKMYTIWEDAERGHEELVAKYKTKSDDKNPNFTPGQQQFIRDEIEKFIDRLFIDKV